jgi:aminoglycoside 2'-N-acetyltransferase I
MNDRPPLVQEVSTAALSPSELAEIRRLLDLAFGDRLSEDDWAHALGGRHFLLRDPREGTLLSHASVVSRTIGLPGRLLSAGYVEAVGTRPGFRGRGLASAVMESVARFIAGHFDIGALSSSGDLYEKLGWIRWLGPTWCRGEGGLVRTPHEDGGVLVLPTPSTPHLDLDADLSVEWREGDVW